MTPMMPPQGQPPPMGGPGMPQQPPMGGPPGQPPGPPQPPPPPPDPQPMDDQGPADDDEKLENLVDYALREANLAKKYAGKKKGQELLDKIGTKIAEGYANDEISRKGWLDRNDQWIKLATLVKSEKTFPWPGASNVKYPMVATAAMQFAARAYPSLVPNDGNLVKAKVIGEDPQGTRQARAIRISRHMSYQFMYKMPNWEEDMDRLCMINPIIGLSFKKTYCREIDGTQASELVLPQHLCVNYWAKDLESAYRKTEILYYTKNEVLEKVRNDEEYIQEVEDYLVPSSTPIDPSKKTAQNPVTKNTRPPVADEATPHTFLACHTFWDLDDDGYEEPYVITIHQETQKVVRITARWQQDGVLKDDKGSIKKIVPLEYFTKFGFIPNPESSIYDLGFGVLLGEINEPVNTLLNQLIDAGTLANLQAGFIGKGLRVKMGPNGFRPGEWKVANATGEDIKNSIVPLPRGEPSQVLFSVLQLLLTAGNQLASIAEIMVGKMPGQNTPATTTQETVEQGMKVFTAIYKRFYRSLYKEIKKLYNLNKIYPSIVDEENSVLNLQLTEDDYQGPDDDLVPGADPSGDSMTAKLSKNQQILQYASMGTLDMGKVTERALKDLEVPNYQELLPQGPPPPSPEQQKAQAEMDAIKAKTESATQLAQMQMSMKQMELQLKKQQGDIETQSKQQQAKIDQMVAMMEMQTKEKQAQTDLRVGEIKAQQGLIQGQQQHAQAMQQNDQQHQVALSQAHAQGQQDLKLGEQAFQMKQKQQQAAAKGKNGASNKGPKRN